MEINSYIGNLGIIATNHFNSVIASSKWAACYSYAVSNFVVRPTYPEEQNNPPTPSVHHRTSKQGDQKEFKSLPIC